MVLTMACSVTRSMKFTEARRPWLVLGWVTTWENRAL